MKQKLSDCTVYNILLVNFTKNLLLVNYSRIEAKTGVYRHISMDIIDVSDVVFFVALVHARRTKLEIRKLFFNPWARLFYLLRYVGDTEGCSEDNTPPPHACMDWTRPEFLGPLIWKSVSTNV